MNIINLIRKNLKNPLEIFVEWLEPDILKINQSIIDNLAGSDSLISDLPSHIINSGGKRIRPALVLLIAKILTIATTTVHLSNRPGEAH